MTLSHPENQAYSAGADASDDATATMAHEAFPRLQAEIGRVVIGQKAVVEDLLIALTAGGHSLLIGLPGLAKTLLVNTLSRLLGLEFKRIQFTPDLMPSDITGTEILEENRDSGHRHFRFLEGPIFTNMLLADEINRTPPKTQAALLEAMQERRVTVGDRTLDLPPPFFVVATQNPIEQEGTYQLPEAQLDRFLLSIHVGYPDEEDELEIMRQTTPAVDIPLEPVLSRDDIVAIQRLVPKVPVAEHVLRYALQVVRRTRPDSKDAPASVRENVHWGAGPRAAQALILASKARALLHGGVHVRIDDVRAVATAALSHRLVTNFHAAAEGLDGEALVGEILAGMPTGDS